MKLTSLRIYLDAIFMESAWEHSHYRICVCACVYVCLVIGGADKQNLEIEKE